MEKKFIKKIVAVLAAVAMVAGLISIMPAEKAKAANSVNVTVSGAYAEELAKQTGGVLNLYMWDGAGSGSWPGTQMTNNGDGTWTLENIVATDNFNAIVNNGTTQTADITDIAIDKKDIYIEIKGNTEFVKTYGEEAASEAVTKPNEYYVAGDEGLCGVDWDVSANQMINNGDGTWTKEFTNIAAGTYGFKVVENASWNNPVYNLDGDASGSAPNATVTVDKDGSTVIVGFNGSRATVSVIEAEKESTTEEETTKKEEASTEEETTKKEEPTTKEEVSTEEETTVKEEPTTEKTTEEETENVTKPSENTKEEGKNSAPETVKKEEIVEPEKVVDTAVEEMEKSDEKTVEVVSPKPQTLTKEIFDTIKSKGKNLTVGVTDADNKLQYSWTFSDKAINNTNMNIDLTITFDAPKKEAISKLTGNKEAAYISFAHHGELPGPATIKTYVGDKYKNGDVVYLYYFDEENNKVLMVGDKPLTIKAGYAEYTITHCSTYFLMGEKLAGVAKDVASLDDANVNVKDSETESTTTSSNPGNTAKPGDNSHIVIWSAILCIMVGIVVFSRKKQLIEE